MHMRRAVKRYKVEAILINHNKSNTVSCLYIKQNTTKLWWKLLQLLLLNMNSSLASTDNKTVDATLLLRRANESFPSLLEVNASPSSSCWSLKTQRELLKNYMIRHNYRTHSFKLIIRLLHIRKGVANDVSGRPANLSSASCDLDLWPFTPELLWHNRALP